MYPNSITRASLSWFVSVPLLGLEPRKAHGLNMSAVPICLARGALKNDLQARTGSNCDLQIWSLPGCQLPSRTYCDASMVPPIKHLGTLPVSYTGNQPEQTSSFPQLRPSYVTSCLLRTYQLTSTAPSFAFEPVGGLCCNYTCSSVGMLREPDLNRRHQGYEPRTLPTELSRNIQSRMRDSNPRCSCSQSRCHTRLGESEIVHAP